MARTELTAAFWDYDRTLPLIRGQIAVEGCDLRCLVLPPQETFVRAFATAEFDVCELSLSRQAQAVARGDNAYEAMPVYLSRAFRHASIYMRGDRGIAVPQELRGRRIGLVNYDDTAAVVVRGLLGDVYGLQRSDITWVVGDLDRKRRETISSPPLTADIPVEISRPGHTLDQQLVEGSIDALIGLVPPPSFGRDPRIVRLFPDWRAAEQAYFKRLRIFPIMHVVGIRRVLSEADPTLVPRIYDAFVAAKAMAMADVAMLQACKTSLPWLVAEYEATKALMGEDYWSYGVQPNRVTLEATMRHLREDGLLLRDVSADELFPSFVDG